LKKERMLRAPSIMRKPKNGTGGGNRVKSAKKERYKALPWGKKPWGGNIGGGEMRLGDGRPRSRGMGQARLRKNYRGVSRRNVEEGGL